MQDFLDNFRVRDQPFALAERFFQPALRIGFARAGRTLEIQENISSRRKSRIGILQGSPLNFRQHLLDIAAGVTVGGSQADGTEFLLDLANRLAAARVPERLSNPLRDSPLARTSHALDFTIFRIREEHW